MARHRHRATVLSRHPDPARSRNPRVRELVSALATLEPAPPPRAEFRAELRMQLLALAPTYLGPAADQAPSPSSRRRRVSANAADVRPAGETGASGETRRSGSAGAAPRTGRARFGRPLAILTCTVAFFALLLGGAVLLSRDALPGDALYGLKRASENVHEAVTDGGSSKGKLLLSFASDRYSEVGDLLPRAGSLGSGILADSGQIDSTTAALVRSTLGSADDDVRQGMQSIGAQAIETHSGSVMKIVIGWYPEPMTEMRAIVARIPAGSLHNRAESSYLLLRSASQRAHQLAALGDCACLSAAPTDDLGPLPCTVCTAPTVPTPGKSGTPTGSETPSPGQSTTSGSTSGANASSAATSTDAPPSGQTSAGSGNEGGGAGGGGGGGVGGGGGGGGVGVSGSTGEAPPTDVPTESLPVTPPSEPLPTLPGPSSLPVVGSLLPPPSSAAAAGGTDSCTPATDSTPVDTSTCQATSGP